MAQIEITMDTKTAQLKITRLLAVTKASTVLNIVGARLMSYVDESFRTRGRGKWKPLSPLTLLTRRFGGNMPLQDSGLYKMSFTKSTDSRTYVEVGSDAKADGGRISLAKIHEFGTKGPYPIHSRDGVRPLAARKRGGGYIIFGPIVMHPGVPPRPVLPTKAVAEKLIGETIDAMLARVGIGR